MSSLRRMIVLSAIFLVLAGISGAPAFAQSHDRARDAVRSGDIRPLGDILRSAQRAYAGEVLDVKLLERGPPSNWRYEVRMQTPNGHVIAVLVDAQSGRVAGARGRGADAARRR